MEENHVAMKGMIQAQEGEGVGIIRDMFENWTQHQNTLVRHCNNLLQHHIVHQRLPPQKLETAPMDIEVQWLAERLLKARIETHQPAFQSWLATAYWCTQLARARLSADPFRIEYGATGKRKRLHLFEKMRAPQICKSHSVTGMLAEGMEREERRRGEPYDEQVAQGLQPSHDQDLMKVITEAKAQRESMEKRRELAKKNKRAKRMAKWRAESKPDMGSAPEDSQEEEHGSDSG